MATSKKEAPLYQPVLNDVGFEVHENQSHILQHQDTPDTSTAEILGVGLGLVREAHKGYREASMQDEVDEQYDQFIRGRDAERKLPEARQTLDTLAWQKNNDLAINDWTPEEQRALDNARADVSKLDRFREQGGSVQAYKIRLEETLKRHISGMPGLASDFRDIWRNKLGDNSNRLDQLVDEERERAKAKDDALWEDKALKTKALSKEINITKPGWKNELFAAMGDEKALIDLQTLRDRGQITAEAAASSPQYAQGSMAITRVLSSQGRLRVDALKAEHGDAKGTVLALEMLENYAQAQIAENNAGFPEGKLPASVIARNNMVEDTHARLVEYAKGNTTKEALTTANEVLHQQMRAELSKNPAWLALSMSLEAMGEAGHRLLQDAAVTKEAARHVVEVYARQARGQKINEMLPGEDPSSDARKEKVAVGWKLLQETAKAYNKNVDNESLVNDPQTAIQLFHSTLDHVDLSKNNEAPHYYDGLATTLGSEDVIKFLEYADPDGKVKQKALQQLEHYFVDGIERGWIDEYDPAQVNIVYNKQGEMLAIAKDSKNPEHVKAASRAQTVWLRRVNAYTKAMANLQNQPRATHAGELATHFMSAALAARSAKADDEAAQATAKAERLSGKNQTTTELIEAAAFTQGNDGPSVEEVGKVFKPVLEVLDPMISSIKEYLNSTDALNQDRAELLALKQVAKDLESAEKTGIKGIKAIWEVLGKLKDIDIAKHLPSITEIMSGMSSAETKLRLLYGLDKETVSGALNPPSPDEDEAVETGNWDDLVQ